MLNRIDLRGISPDAISAKLPRPEIAGEGPRSVVRDIIAQVRANGDEALVELSRRFDGVDRCVAVSETEIQSAVDQLDPAVREALEVAISQVELFHRHQLRPPHQVVGPGLQIEAYQRPVRRAGLYVPGGRAEYPSTVVMTAVPARVAGVEQVILCVPASKDLNGVAPTVLAAARLAGVNEIYAVGGAQAIAAMAYGTDSIAPVDVIAGPGNIYVALAKQEVSGDVGVAAAFAGPSEVVVVADGSVDPVYAAVDVLVQAEHGPDGMAWLVTWEPEFADAVCVAGESIVAGSPRAAEIRSTLETAGFAAVVDDRKAAMAVVNAVAPEHLQLMCREPRSLVDDVHNAGAIFCGPWSPASVGDYVAGPSHVLPTNGSARFSSALTVGDFTKDHHVITLDRDGLERLGPHVVALAEVEGLTTHAESVRLRLDGGTQNGQSSEAGQ